RGLESAEAQIERGAAHARARKRNGAWIAAARLAFDRAPARITEAEELRRLVECLAGRVVPCLTEQPIAVVRQRPVEGRVATGDDQSEKGSLDRTIELDREQVTLDVVDAHQRQAACARDRLGGR